MMKYISTQSLDVSKALLNLRQLTFEVTDNCNLKCKYCGYGEFYDGYDNREAKNLSIEYAFKLIDYLSEIGNQGLTNAAKQLTNNGLKLTTMKNLKLNILEQNQLSSQEMKDINGGYDWECSCSCYYEGNGGSSTYDNGHANSLYIGGRHSEKGEPKIEFGVTRTDS